MIKKQKQVYLQPVLAHILLKQQASRPKLKSRNADPTLVYQQKQITLKQSKSSNNYEHVKQLTPKLNSLQYIREKNSIISSEYQLNIERKRKIQIIQEANKQYLRDNTSTSSYGKTANTITKAKSKYKYAKQKALKFVQRNHDPSNQAHTAKQNQINNKIQQVKNLLNQRNLYSNTQQMQTQTQKNITKCASITSFGRFKPKIDKCSPLRITSNQKTSIVNRQNSRNKEQFKYFNSDKVKSQDKFNCQPSIEYYNDLNVQSNRCIEMETTSQKKGQKSSNPLVLKQAHLFTQYGIPSYSSPSYKMPTQKQLKQEAQHTCKQISKQMLISRKQTQKLISRARQKNKKVMGKLRERKSQDNRNSFRNSQDNKNSLMNSQGNKNNQANRNSLRNQEANHNAFNSSRLAKEFNKLTTEYSPESTSSGTGMKFHDKMKESKSRWNELTNENFLSIDSRVLGPEVTSFNEQTKQKILLHLEMLTILADYAQSFVKIYQDCSQWEQLIFLLYKKYYIERVKVYQILRQGQIKFFDGSIQSQSPFVFDFCRISTQQLNDFRQSKQHISLEIKLVNQNIMVKNAVRDLYNKFIEKTSQNSNMNMYSTNDFTEDVLEDLNEEINMLIQSCGKSNKIKYRINQAIRVGLILAHLEGFYLKDIEQIVSDDVQDMQFYQKFYPQFLSIFNQQQA